MPKLGKRSVDAIRPDPNGREVFVWDTGDGALKGDRTQQLPRQTLGAIDFAVDPRIDGR